MSKVYINLHPDYPYATAIIGSGFIEELADYVRNVDWLMWEMGRKRQIIISGTIEDR